MKIQPDEFELLLKAFCILRYSDTRNFGAGNWLRELSYRRFLSDRENAKYLVDSKLGYEGRIRELILSPLSGVAR